MNNFFTEEQISKLKEKTDKKYIHKKPSGRGDKIDYVSISYVTTKLNEILGNNWNFEILNVYISEFPNEKLKSGKTVHNKEYIIHGRLTVFGNDRDLIREQFGSHKSQIANYGDAIKSATSDCLKKIASSIGVAADVYGNDIEFEDDNQDTKHDVKKDKTWQDVYNELPNENKEVIEQVLEFGRQCNMNIEAINQGVKINFKKSHLYSCTIDELHKTIELLLRKMRYKFDNSINEDEIRKSLESKTKADIIADIEKEIELRESIDINEYFEYMKVKNITELSKDKLIALTIKTKKLNLGV